MYSLSLNECTNNSAIDADDIVYVDKKASCYIRIDSKHLKNLLNLGPVHTKSEKFDNAALFLLLGLPSTLIRHENGAFRKRSSNRRNLKMPAFRFLVGGKHFENGAFRNDDVTMIM